ncbi:MAG: hypothetical protein ACK4YM_00495 [Novosphingobium sp.]
MNWQKLIGLAAFFLVPLMFSGRLSSATISEQPNGSEVITVLGNRGEQAGIAGSQAKAITLRPAIDTPLSRHYQPICLRLFGIDPAYGEPIADRIRNNIRWLGLPVGKENCQPNVWIGFFSNSKAEVERLRKREPAMFASLAPHEFKRIFAGSGAVQVWHATETRSLDGRPIPVVRVQIGDSLSGRDIETGYNAQYRAGRLVSPIRNDINGTIVVFDRGRANGLTIQQLADYATFRILAPVQDFAQVEPNALPSILQLFTPGAMPPDGLTEFDWAYLAAYYKLDRGAGASAVHDATRRAMLDGTGQKLREKAAAD